MERACTQRDILRCPKSLACSYPPEPFTVACLRGTSAASDGSRVSLIFFDSSCGHRRTPRCRTRWITNPCGQRGFELLAGHPGAERRTIPSPQLDAQVALSCAGTRSGNGYVVLLVGLLPPMSVFIFKADSSGSVVTAGTAESVRAGPGERPETKGVETRRQRRMFKAW